jgi:histidinol-phosphate aminotransferase
VADLNDSLRADLRGLTPYGAPQLTVPVQLNVNENTHGIPEAVALDIVSRTAAAVLSLNRYPDREFLELRSAFAKYLGHDLAADQIWAANGSNEVLLHIFQAFGGPGRKALSFGPTYSMYPNIARTSITEYVELPRESGFALSASYVAASIAEQSPDIVILCTPNNPTGTGLSLEVIESAYEAFDGILVIDEAYAEFSDQPSALSLLAGRERLLISRTMSKAFAFAGARVGYLAASSPVIDALRLVRLPYHLSALTQAAALAALDHAPTMLATVSQIVTQRRRIEAAAESLGLFAHPSEANFVLLEGVSDPNLVFEALLDRGILIRNVGLPQTLRVTAGTESETTKLLASLALVLS